MLPPLNKLLLTNLPNYSFKRLVGRRRKNIIYKNILYNCLVILPYIFVAALPLLCYTCFYHLALHFDYELFVRTRHAFHWLHGIPRINTPYGSFCSYFVLNKRFSVALELANSSEPVTRFVYHAYTKLVVKTFALIYVTRVNCFNWIVLHIAFVVHVVG